VLFKTQEEEIYGVVYETELKPFDRISVTLDAQKQIDFAITNKTHILATGDIARRRYPY
jgi:hypothetical protein